MSETEPTQQALASAYRPKLEAERDEIRALSSGTSGDRAPVALDQQSVGRLSRMDAMQGKAMAQAADRRRQERAVLISAALARMEEGEYGYCVDCGEFIGARRLDFDPAAPRCVTCAGGGGR